MLDVFGVIIIEDYIVLTYHQSLVQKTVFFRSLRAMMYKMVIVKNQGKFSIWLTKWKFFFSNFSCVFLTIKGSLGTIPKLRQHIFGLFLTHPTTMSAYSTELQQKWPFSEPNHSPSSLVEVIKGWPLVKNQGKFYNSLNETENFLF